MKFTFVRNNEGAFEVDEMCSALEISRSGYYAWRDGSVSARQIEDEAIGDLADSLTGEGALRTPAHPQPLE